MSRSGWGRIEDPPPPTSVGYTAALVNASKTVARPELARDLGITHTTAVVVGTIIGSGIFLVPAEMMQAVGSVKLVYLAWIVGGVLSFFGAMVYAELGAMKPEAGGEYVYLRDSFGPLAGFLDAWTWFLVSKPASIATLSSGIVRVLGNFVAFSFFTHPVAGIHYGLTYGHLVAVGATLLIRALNSIGIRRAGEFQLVFTIIKVLIILVIVAACFSYSGGSFSKFFSPLHCARGGIAGFVSGM